MGDRASWRCIIPPLRKGSGSVVTREDSTRISLNLIFSSVQYLFAIFVQYLFTIFVQYLFTIVFQYLFTIFCFDLQQFPIFGDQFNLSLESQCSQSCGDAQKQVAQDFISSVFLKFVFVFVFVFVCTLPSDNFCESVAHNAFQSWQAAPAFDVDASSKLDNHFSTAENILLYIMLLYIISLLLYI